MLTLVVPSYNRHQYLTRIFNYYKNSNFRVIVADGSDTSLDPLIVKNLPQNVTYYYEKIPPAQRLVNTLPLIQTPYACLLGDDELHLISSLQECINFLNSNKEYVSCTGTPLGFKFSNNFDGLEVKPIYPEFKDHIINQESFSDRIYSHLNPYVSSSIYGVLRASTFKTAMLACNIKTSCVYAPEIAIELSNSALGKLHILQKISWLRNFEVPSISNKSHNRKYRFHHWYNDLNCIEEKNAWTSELSRLLEPHTSSDIKVLIEKSLNAYVSKCTANKPSRFDIYLNKAKHSVKIIFSRKSDQKTSPFGNSLETERTELIKLNQISDLNDFNSAFDLIKRDHTTSTSQYGHQ